MATLASAANDSLSRTAIRLRAGCWLDLPSCALFHGAEALALTAQEVRLLNMLAADPHRFHSPDELARALTRPGAYEVASHSLHQTVSGLRKKLRVAHADAALVCRRGLGYMLCAEHDDPAGTQ